MAYARKIPLETLQLKLFEEFAKHLLNIFLSISWHSQRVDLIFVVYVEDRSRHLKETEGLLGSNQ